MANKILETIVKSEQELKKREQEPQKSEQEAQKSEQERKSKYTDVVKSFCMEPRSGREIQEHIGIKSRSYFQLKILKKLLEAGEIAFIYPDNKNSKNQKYITNVNKEKIYEKF